MTISTYTTGARYSLPETNVSISVLALKKKSQFGYFSDHLYIEPQRKDLSFWFIISNLIFRHTTRHKFLLPTKSLPSKRKHIETKQNQKNRKYT